MEHTRHFLRFGILVAMVQLPALAGNVTLAWNANTNPIVAGYNIFYRIKGSVSTNKISIGNTSSVTISNLAAGYTYLFTARTYDASGVESPLSSEVAFTMPYPPTLSIATPTFNQQETNGVLTAAGKASDNAAVASVFCSLNGSAWTAAATANQWTNWSATLNLTPGTNLVQFHAADVCGNCSATSSVRFVYLVRLPLTLRIAGQGLVYPNYNGAALAINENYTTTAYAATYGFAFTNWTDGWGNVVTNRATLQFTMATNLALTANFMDVARPTVSIVTPTSNQQWTNGTFTVTGKAGDNVAVSAVYYSLNGSAWTAATTGNNWTNWSANLTLTPGTNTVQAYAVDTSGNRSPTNSVNFEYVVLKPLTLRIAGQGLVHPNYNGAALAINENYTMTAYASTYGFGFTNWTDGWGNVATNRATLQFTMAANLALTANFADVIRPTLSLLTPAANLRVSNVVLRVTGTAGDNVAVGAVYYSLNGSGWTAAATGNNWTNWSAQVMLKPGTNTVRVFAADTAGNTSPTNSNLVNLVVPPAAAATLSPAAYGNGRYAFLISGATGYKYVIQASTDLVNWVSLQTNIAPFTFVDTNVGRFSRQFYRTFFNP